MTVHALGGFAGNGETDARAFVMGTVEPLEDAKDFVVIPVLDADAVVLDKNRQGGGVDLLGPDLHARGRVRPGEFQGVAEQVGENLFEEGAVGGDVAEVGGGIDMGAGILDELFRSGPRPMSRLRRR